MEDTSTSGRKSIDMKKRVRKIARRLFHLLGLEISRDGGFRFRFSTYNPKRWGVNPFADIERRIDKSERTIVFDVGSNVGGVVEHIKDRMPESEIHAFEPCPATFEFLVQNTRYYSNTFQNNLGLGSSCGKQILFESSSSVLSSLFKPGEACSGRIVSEIPVNVTTVDIYCNLHNIPYITLLKLDTQGNDLEVLKGASDLLELNRVQMVFIEIIFVPLYEGTPSLDEIFRFMRDRDFVLSSFYNFFFRDGVLCWCDALFINENFDCK